jgi:hypothetical protein
VSFLRNLWADLIGKKLWPVALLLVGALVAVPVLLGGSGSGGDDAATPAGGGNATAATQIRVSEETDASTISPVGSKNNPFTQPKVKKESTASEETPSDTSGDTAPATGGTAPSTDTTTTTPTDTTTTPETDEKEEESTTSIRVDLRFGEPGVSKQKLHSDIARLSALPSADNPIVIYLGVKDDKKTATFLIPADATATGDGVCKPATTNCQTIEMQEGDSTFLDIDLGSGVRQFRLDVTRVGEEDEGTAKKASAARARVSNAGRELLRSTLESGELELKGLDYDEKAGTLTSTPRATTAGPVGRGAYRVDVKVGGITRTDVRRLQMLPLRTSPKLLFLGVREGGRSASFLNLEDAPVAGGLCKPSREQCHRLTLRAGRTAFVGGVPVSVTALTLRRLATEALAQDARVREDEVGRELVTDDELDLGDLALDPSTGTLAAAPL